MADYSPQQDPAIPCADAGMSFRKGDVLEIVDQTDALWWQAKKLPSNMACAGLIPSTNLLKRSGEFVFVTFFSFPISFLVYWCVIVLHKFPQGAAEYKNNRENESENVSPCLNSYHQLLIEGQEVKHERGPVCFLFSLLMF